MFETTMFRSLKSHSGTSGEPERASIRRKTASSAPAAARSPRVCAVSQPTSFPFTIA